ATELARSQETTQSDTGFSPVGDGTEYNSKQYSAPRFGSLDQIRARCSEKIAVEDFYERLRQIGVQLNGSFRGIESIQRCDGEALALVQLPDIHSEGERYNFHPALLDASLQILMAALPVGMPTGAGDSLYLFVGMKRFEVYSRPASRVWSHASLCSNNAQLDD